MAACMLTGCYSNRQIGLLQDRKGIPTYDSVPYEPYRLHVNDQIVYRLITMDETISKAMAAEQMSYNAQYAVSYRIQSDGTVDIPFLPPIKMEGLTEREAQDTLQAVFRQIIPDADVKLALYNKNFTVLGDLGSGQYKIYKERMTIFQALAMTGDVNNKGDRKHVRIIRPKPDSDQPEILDFDIRSNTIIDSKYYYIYPNDVIYVARTKDSFVKLASYTGFLGLITSSVSLLISVLNYSTTLSK